MLNQSKLTPTQKDYVRAARKSSNILFNLVNDILDISKIEAGKVEIEAIPFDANQVIEDVYESLHYEARKKGIKLKFNSNNLLANVIGDPMRVKQVLFNLVHNAIKFTHEGTVEINLDAKTIENQQMQILFEIKDTGIGMSKDFLARIFTPFSQSDSSTTRKFGGTGLGLSIASRLIALMNGSISVQSREGAGTSFLVSLNLPQALEKPKKVDVTKRKSFKKLNVFIVEDNEINQLLIQKMLSHMGHRAVVVPNGRVALEHTKKSVFDLILMDCYMPEMDGFEATQQIRSHESSLNQKTPIVALTADVTVGVKDKCRSAGMSGYISKPVTIKKVGKLLEKIKSRKKLLDTATLNKLSRLNAPGQADIRAELIQTYVDSFEQRIALIENQYSEKSLKSLAQSAHTLKSASHIVGAQVLGDLCYKIEFSANNSNLDELNQCMRPFRARAEDTVKVLKAYLNGIVSGDVTKA